MSKLDSALSSAVMAGAMSGGNPLAAIGGGVAGWLGGSDSDPYEKQKKALEEQLNYLRSIKSPTAKDLEVKSYLESVVGKMQAEKEAAETINKNELASLQANPELVQKQMDQLALLEQISKSGMTPTEEASQRQLMRQLEGQSQSKIADIQREEAQRGTSSSGAGMLAKMIAQQQSQNQASQSADQLMAQMFQNKLAASGQASGLAGQLEQTQYGREAQKAQNQQAINEFNAQMKAQTQARNIAAQNQAQMYNLQNAQNVANRNTDIRNQEAYHRANIAQQMYNNEIAKSGLTSGATNALSGFYGQQAGRQADQALGQAQAVGIGVGGLAKNWGDVKNTVGNWFSNVGSGDPTGSTSMNYGTKDYGQVMAAAHGGMVEDNSCYANGGKVESIDNTKNDKVPAMLTEGEAVIPKSIMENPNAGILAKHYVEGLLKKVKGEK